MADDEDRPPPSCTAAAAAASSLTDQPDDEEVALRFLVLERLVHAYGFSQELAESAVEAVGLADNGGSADAAVAACCEHLLDSGVPDRGGPVAPIADCPHVAKHAKITVDQLPLRPQACPCTHFRDVRMSAATTAAAAPSPPSKCDGAAPSTPSRTGGGKAVVTEDGTCPPGENWLCLHCGVVRCSRYVNAHGLEHWRATRRDGIGGGGGGDGNDTSNTEISSAGHCIALSLADLSVWCHECKAYIQHPALAPILRRVEALKFAGDEPRISMVRDSGVHGQEGPGSPPRKKKRKGHVASPMETESEGEPGQGGAPDGRPEKAAAAATSAHAATSSSGSDADEGDEDDSESDEEESPSIPHDADSDLLDMIRAAAAARGIPFEWLLHESQEDDDDGEIEYPFETMPTSPQELADFILSPSCRSILVLAGAGMSVAAGIPDFRSADGLYSTMNADLLSADESQRRAMRLDPTVALEQNLFLENPLPCLELNREFILGTCEQKWKATLAHRFVELLHAKTNKLVRLYTQNIDGLEDQCPRLPRDKVINVHGTMDRAECATCRSEGDMAIFADQVRRQIKDLSRRDTQAPEESTPIDCAVCGCNTMKPAIVLFRSSLPKEFFEKLPGDTAAVDLLIVIGTSLRVAPANSVVWRVPKSALRVLVNREPAGRHLGIEFDPAESKRDYFAQGDCDEVVLELMTRLGWLDDLTPLLETQLLPESSSRLLRGRVERGPSASTSGSGSTCGNDADDGREDCAAERAND